VLLSVVFGSGVACSTGVAGVGDCAMSGELAGICVAALSEVAEGDAELHTVRQSRKNAANKNEKMRFVMPMNLRFIPSTLATLFFLTLVL